jgi:hypothetical protein
VGKRSRKRRGPADRTGAAASPKRKAGPAKRAGAAQKGASSSKRRGPELKPWPERPSVTRAKNAAAREALRAQQPSRSERKNEEARANLEPLAPGERPRAVTAGVVVTLGLIVANVVLYVTGLTVRGDAPALIGFLAFSAVMVAMAWGLWRARYWAVLGLEALLGMIIVGFSLLATRIETPIDALISALVLIPACTLFWFLIKAMARIQMPRRPGAE